MAQLFDTDDIKLRLLPVFENSLIERATLFGSYALGTAVEQSDIDIVVDSRGKIRGIEFYAVLEDITEALGMKVDLFELSEIQPHSPIMDEINRQGVVIYER
ncbi:MAG: nucleotidyltransferase domain-containing protein [Coriobacteriales bacterium]|nr:nucleotidyltransferase domain-containing protein [Coriobacteriales bacterium]